MVFKEDTHPFKENKFVQYVRARIKKNKNCIIVITGATGTGKSYIALTLGQAIDPIREELQEDGSVKQIGFDISRVVFSASDFLAQAERDLYPGAVIVFDEAGVDINSRRSMTNMNVAMSTAFQTIRWKRHVIILTVPSLAMVDKHVRMLAHILITTKRICMETERTLSKVSVIIPSAIKDKIYYPHPRIKVNGKVICIPTIKTSKPTYAMIRAYESMKHAFGKAHIQEGRAMVDKGTKYDMKLTEKEKEIYAAISKWKLRPAQIAENLKVTLRDVYCQVATLRKKGYLKSRDKRHDEKIIEREVLE